MPLVNIHINPLLIPILEFLRSCSEPVSEFDLMTQVKPYLETVGHSGDPQFILFQNHFLIMNALYQLQDKLIIDGLHVSISPLKIFLAPLVSRTSSSLSEDHSNSALRKYYLDWDNFVETSAGDIDALLSHFWLKFSAGDKQQQSLSSLGLQPDSSWKDIRSAYRVLAAKHHPDKGGDITQFIKVREAYEILSLNNDRKAG